jgi:hypothetical protein
MRDGDKCKIIGLPDDWNKHSDETTAVFEYVLGKVFEIVNIWVFDGVSYPLYELEVRMPGNDTDDTIFLEREYLESMSATDIEC